MSVGTSLIPFLEHNDGNRTLMGSNMQRQALILENPELPFIQTEVEKYIALESQSTIITKHSGKICYVSSKKIIMKYSFDYKYFNRLCFNSFKLKFLNSKFKWINKKFILDTIRKSNQNTKIVQNITIKKHDWVKKGQVVASGLGVLRGNLAIGKNLLIGYIGWGGFNFEDAIIINERLKNEDVFTSIQIKSYKTFLLYNKKEKV